VDQHLYDGGDGPRSSEGKGTEGRCLHSKSVNAHTVQASLCRLLCIHLFIGLACFVDRSCWFVSSNTMRLLQTCTKLAQFW